MLISDSMYSRLKFKRNLKYWPDLKNPRTFNEKLCWLKLHHRDPMMSIMVDKADAKNMLPIFLGKSI